MGASMKAIPSSKEGEDLRTALEELHSYSSSWNSFILHWKDLEDHLSSIQNSIEELESNFRSAAPPPAPASDAPEATAHDEPAEDDRRPELNSLYARMKGKGLESYIIENTKNIGPIWLELRLAIRSAPDPALLVLDVSDVFHHPKSEGNLSFRMIWRTWLRVLGEIQVLAPDIKPFVRDRAKKLALELKAEVSEEAKQNVLKAICFLQFLVSYGLVSEFKVDDLLDLLVIVSHKKGTVDLVRSMGLVKNIPDLIQKLIDKRDQVLALKFVYAFNLLDKYSPVPLLKAFMTRIESRAQQQPGKGKKAAGAEPSQPQPSNCNSSELAALRAVVRAVEEYKLESEYPCENLRKRIAEVEPLKVADKKLKAGSTSKNQQQTQHQSIRGLHPSTISQPAAAATAAAATTLPPVAHPFPLAAQPVPRVVHGRATATGSLYDREVPGVCLASVAPGGNPTPASDLYSFKSLSASGLFGRPVQHGWQHGISGLSASHHLPFHYP